MPMGPDPLATPKINPIKPPIIPIDVTVNINGFELITLGSLILLPT